MLPGLIRRPWIPPSSAAMAYFHWKWMSAMTGMVACSAIVLRASASSQWGTATRTISQPAATSEAICWSVALTSAVLVVHIDCTRTGASPPTSTHPTLIVRDFRLFVSIYPRVQYVITSPSSNSQNGPVARVVCSIFSAALVPEDVKDDRALLGLIELQQQ